MEKIYPTLYARSTTGKVLEWFVEQQDDKYRVVSGQRDGKHVTNEWTTASPKNVGKVNETSGTSQAILEIHALYTKKKKQKYKDTVEDIDVQTFFKPMLAKNYKDYPIDDFSKWCSQIKYNGGRCIATKDGLFTRTGERYLSIPHIENDLRLVFEANPDLVFDGELFNYEYRQQLNELMKLIRKTVNITENDLIKSEQLVQYHVYDMYVPDKPDMPYNRRKDALDTILSFGQSKYYRPVSSIVHSDKNDLENRLNEVISDGQEGLILRKLDSIYENKRSRNLLKMKIEDDAEGVIQQVNEGTGNWADKCKSFTLLWHGKEFDASLVGSMEQAEDIWKDQQNWINRRVTFKYMGLTGLGTPNFARIDYNNCIPST